MFDWWDRFVWGYATDIEEYDEEEVVNITINIELGE